MFDNLPPDIQYLIDGWVGLDAPRHSELRRLVSSPFTPKRIRSLERRISRHCPPLNLVASALVANATSS